MSSLVGGNMTTKITINGETYTPEELGLERIIVNGKRYIDVTPFWLDSTQSRVLDEKIHGAKPKPGDFERRGMNE